MTITRLVPVVMAAFIVVSRSECSLGNHEKIGTLTVARQTATKIRTEEGQAQIHLPQGGRAAARHLRGMSATRCVPLSRSACVVAASTRPGDAHDITTRTARTVLSQLCHLFSHTTSLGQAAHSGTAVAISRSRTPQRRVHQGDRSPMQVDYFKDIIVSVTAVLGILCSARVHVQWHPELAVNRMRALLARIAGTRSRHPCWDADYRPHSVRPR